MLLGWRKRHQVLPFTERTDREAEAIMEGLTYHQHKLKKNEPYAEGLSVNSILRIIDEEPMPEPCRWKWFNINLPLIDWKLARKRVGYEDVHRLLTKIALEHEAGNGDIKIEISDGHCSVSRNGLRVSFIPTTPIPADGLLLLAVETISH